MRPRAFSPHRRGYVLVYFTMIVFVLFAVAALIIDVGFAFVTRRQMQTATDAAALEGLRWRDSSPDPMTADNTRRMYASTLLKNVFTDNDSPDAGPRNFGAGPVVEFTDESAVELVDGFKASETLHVPSGSPGSGINPAGYNPSDPNRSFQTNGWQGSSGNDPAGDMVSGVYTGSPTNPAHLPLWHHEDANYNRPPKPITENEPILEFLPDTRPPSSQPPGNAFLVRMRRSNEGQQPDHGLSSGPTVPYLFGRGLLLAPRLKGQGIIVRATSIADARPAMAVGPSLPVLNPSTNTFTSLPGLAPFEIDYTYWQTLTTDTVQINTNTGQITSQTSGGVAGQMIRLTALSNSQVGPSDRSIQVVSAAGFPNSAPFTIRIDDELMSGVNSMVSGNGSVTWSVTRGVDGTTPASHNGNAAVNLIDIASVGQSTQQPTIIGSILGSSANGLASTGPQAVQHALAGTFVPIFVSNDPMSGQTVYRIVGFGQAYLTVTPSSTGGSPTVTITKQPSSIASQNAIVRYIPPLDAITGDQLNAILGPSGYYSQFRANPQRFAPLLAPALVRSE